MTFSEAVVWKTRARDRLRLLAFDRRNSRWSLDCRLEERRAFRLESLQSQSAREETQTAVAARLVPRLRRNLGGCWAFEKSCSIPRMHALCLPRRIEVAYDVFVQIDVIMYMLLLRIERVSL